MRPIQCQWPNNCVDAGAIRQTRIYHGLIDDAYGPQMIPLIGADRVLWGSDFPHIRSIGLGAQEHVQKLFGALPPQDQERVVGGNAAKVFKIG